MNVGTRPPTIMVEVFVVGLVMVIVVVVGAASRAVLVKMHAECQVSFDTSGKMKTYSSQEGYQWHAYHRQRGKLGIHKGHRLMWKL